MLISIVVPFYNTEKDIARCIESCLSQDYCEIELLLVNDGSTDGSYTIASNYAELDHRIHLYSQINQGAAKARNKGIDGAVGDYVLFVDSDDWIDPDMVKTMINVALGHPNIQVIQSVVPGDMKQQHREGIYYNDEAVKCLLEGSWWGPCCKLIRKDALESLRFPEKTISEDYVFNYLLFSGIDSIFYLHRSFYHRTFRQDSLSRIKLSKRKFDEYYNVKTVSDLVAKDYPQYLSLADSHLAGTCLKLLFIAFQNHAESHYPEEIDEILDCIRSKYTAFLKNPYIPKNERILLSTCFSKTTAWFSERLYHMFR